MGSVRNTCDFTGSFAKRTFHHKGWVLSTKIALNFDLYRRRFCRNVSKKQLALGYGILDTTSVSNIICLLIGKCVFFIVVIFLVCGCICTVGRICISTIFGIADWNHVLQSCFIGYGTVICHVYRNVWQYIFPALRFYMCIDLHWINLICLNIAVCWMWDCEFSIN